jgi:hypothetical protein
MLQLGVVKTNDKILPQTHKVKHDLQKGDFVVKVNVAKMGLNLISLKCKMESNMFFYLPNS